MAGTCNTMVPVVYFRLLTLRLSALRTHVSAVYPMLNTTGNAPSVLAFFGAPFPRFFNASIFVSLCASARSAILNSPWLMRLNFATDSSCG